MAKLRMAPPRDNSHEPIMVNGRSYACAVGSSIDVEDFDALVLGANGWAAVGVQSANGAAFYPTSDEASIRDAALSASLAGGGTVHLPVGNIQLTAPLSCYAGVTYQGVRNPLTYPVSSIPDSQWSFAGGTVLICDGTFDAFNFNTTPAGSPANPFAGSGIAGFSIKNLGISNPLNGIAAGATNRASFFYGSIENIMIENARAWGVNIVNSMHMTYSGIWTKSCLNGQRYANDVPQASLQTGNSQFHGIFNAISETQPWIPDRRQCRALVFEALQGLLDQCFLSRIQSNRFGPAVLSVSVTLTSGNTSIAVPDSTAFAVGMPVVFTTTANGATALFTYSVLSIVDATHITIGLLRSGAAFSPTGSGSMTMQTGGFPNIEVVGAAGATVNQMEFRHVDTEGTSGAALYVERAANNVFTINNTVTCPGGMIVGRTATYSTIESTSFMTSDIDTGSICWIGPAQQHYRVSPYGLGYNNISGTRQLCLTSSTGTPNGDIQVRVTNTLVPIVPFGERYGSRDTTLTMTAAVSGNLVFNGATGQTLTLPTIVDDTTPINSHLGVVFRIYNVSANSVTVATDGTQLFNNVGGKISLTVLTQHVLTVKALKTAGGTLFWSAHDDALS